MPAFERIIKRAVDVTVSTVLLATLAVPLMLNVVVCWLLNGMPVFYRSVRKGQGGRSFQMFKFRSMVAPDRLDLEALSRQYMRDGFLDIPLESPVYTRWGRFMENTQIVELPQLLHVLTGRMSLVGNRPLPEENVRLLVKTFGTEAMERFDSPMGITGPSQVVGKFNLSPHERLHLEMLYARLYRRGGVLKADLYITWLTLKLVVFRGQFISGYDPMRKRLEGWLENSQSDPSKLVRET